MDLPRMLSRPHEVRFAGWRTTTTELQQAGWSLSAEQDMMRRSIRLAMEFRPARLFMLSEAQEYDFYRRAEYAGRGDQMLVFQVRNVVGSEIRVAESLSLESWSPIDAKPQFTTTPIRSLTDMGIFAVPMARTDEILVEPATVAGLLEQIKKLHEPELQAIRERNARRARDAGSTEHGMVQRQNFHAQIVSLAA